jgi:RecA/RadA recombinase
MGEAAAATEALARIQQRWGVGVIRRGRVVVDPQLRGLVVRSSGFAALDALLAPRGAPDGLTLLRGAIGSGRTTLALRTAAATQAAGGAVAWIDASHTFDGVEAAARGVQLSSLPIVMPVDINEALETAGSIIAADAADLLILDCAGVRASVRGEARVDALERLAARARRTGAAVFALVDSAEGVLSDLSLECSTVGWLRIGSDVVGRKMCVALRSGPRRDAQVLIDVLEPRSAREAIRNERIAAE